MKYRVYLLLALVCSATLLFAKDKGKKMTGTICSSACVVKAERLPTCDPTCTAKSGDAVFISDSGSVMKIENPDMAMPHMGKRVKMMATPTEKEREESLRIMQLYEQTP